MAKKKAHESESTNPLISGIDHYAKADRRWKALEGVGRRWKALEGVEGILFAGVIVYRHIAYKRKNRKGIEAGSGFDILHETNGRLLREV